MNLQQVRENLEAAQLKLLPFHQAEIKSALFLMTEALNELLSSPFAAGDADLHGNFIYGFVDKTDAEAVGITAEGTAEFAMALSHYPGVEEREFLAARDVREAHPHLEKIDLDTWWDNHDFEELTLAVASAAVASEEYRLVVEWRGELTEVEKVEPSTVPGREGWIRAHFAGGWLDFQPDSETLKVQQV